MTVRHLTFALLALGGVVWLAAIVSAPVVLRDTENRWRASAAAAYVVGAIVCHQRPDRSFHTAGIKWPVCARCGGLYAGAAFGLLLWPLLRLGRRRDDAARAHGRRDHVRNWRVMMVALSIPTILTLVSGTFGVFDPPNAWRAALALPLGLAAGSLLAAVVLRDLR